MHNTTVPQLPATAHKSKWFAKFVSNTLCIRTALYILMAIALPFAAVAESDPPVVTQLSGYNIAGGTLTTTIDNGNFCEVQDPIYYNLTERDRIADVTKDKYKNTIALYVNEESTAFIPGNFVCTVTVNITYYDLNEVQQTINNIPLQISYTKEAGAKYDARQYYYLENARKVRVQVVSVTGTGVGGNSGMDPRKVLILENRLAAVRDYKFNCQDVVTFDTRTPYNDELNVKWLFADDKGATNFDLEWAWVDAESADNYKTVFTQGNPAVFDARLIFSRNSTRVTLPKNVKEYKIPLLYDGSGYLFYRTRPVQYKENGDIFEGAWNVVTTVANANYYLFTGHEDNQFNWQASTSFAEEGKRKTVIQYFDGTLRSRQTVTKDNSQDDKTTVVAETLYDYQGRPVINILPAPTLNTVLSYARNFNRFTGQTAANHPKDMYDALGSAQNICNSTPLALDNTQGAAQYYSPNNALPKTGTQAYNQFIPDAEGFPYTETRYSNDATGRVMEQSGVGAAHQLNSGHQTKYYYGSAFQEELDPLFGVEVGHASHYFKNMVVDANSQVSISYVDMHGRTIATALAGDAPGNVEPLASAAPALQTITKSLLTPLNNVVNDRSVVGTTTITVDKAGPHTFAYNLGPQSAEIIACNPLGQTVCYDCYYTLQIKVTDECGNVFLDESRDNLSFVNGDPVYDPDCGIPALPIAVTFNPVVLPVGAYNVTKILTVDKTAQDWYRENVFKNKNICKTLDQIKTEILAQLQLESDCATMTCATCTTAVGPTLADFRTKYLKALYPSGIPQNLTLTPQQEASIEASYKEAIEHCSILCQDVRTELDDIEDDMLEDMKPQMGQYARADVDIDNNGSTTDIIGTAPDEQYENGSIRAFNILEKGSYPVATHVPAQQEPFFKVPRDALGNPIVYKTDADVKDPDAYETNGTAVISKQDFIKNFKDSWAKQLLYYHPEYPKLQYAKTLLQSYEFNRDLEAIEKWSDASAAGYFTTPDYLINIDPFFSMPENAGRKTEMLAYMNIAYQYPGMTGAAQQLSLWQLAYASVACINETSTTSTCATSGPKYPNAAGWNLITDRCESDKDYIWQAFKSVYLTLKNDFVNQVLDTKTPAITAAFNQAPYTAGINKCQRRFISFAQMLQPGNLLHSLIEKFKNNSNATADAEMLAQYQENCADYIEFWKHELKDCLTNVSEQAQQNLMEELKNICVEGSDGDHPLGASSVKPGSAYIDPNRRFEDKILQFLDVNGIPVTALCHPYLITSPRPYENQLPVSDDVVIDIKDECVCNNLTLLKNKMLLKGYSISPATLPTNMRTFLINEFKITMDVTLLATLINGCTSVPAPQCNTYNPPLKVPGFLTQCKTMVNNCITCTEYQTLKQQFITKFSPRFAVTGIMHQPQANQELTPQQLKENELFAVFMNNQTGLNKSWHNYLAFETECAQAINATPTNCAPLQNVINNYYNWFYTQPSYTISRDPNGCDRRAWSFFRTDTIPGINFFSSIFSNGKVAAPGGKFHFDYAPDICIGNDFTVTYRVKPLTVQSSAQIYLPISLRYGTNNNTVFYLWMKSNNDGEIQIGSGSRITISGLGFAPYVNQWVNVSVRLRPSDGNYWVYVNGNQVHTGTTTFVDINRITAISVQTNGPLEIELDRIKIDDNTNGNIILDEEFTGACSQFSIINPAYDCGKLNCTTAFVNCFNATFNPPQVYTQAQIQTLYTGCGISLPNLCVTAPVATGPLLCGRLEPVGIEEEEEYNPCDYLNDLAIALAKQRYKAYVTKQYDQFDNTYLTRCLEARNYESLTVTSQAAQYHYTLYYYDQAGNLVKTVPPQGVNPNYSPTWAAAVKAARENNTPFNPANVPTHTLATQYRYNSLNQVTAQLSPDGGLSRFWYDELGRLVISQNAKQRTVNKYSYTIYDALGRIKEVGQKPNATAMTQTLSQNKISLQGWLYNGVFNKEEITRTTYDEVAPNIMPPPTNTSFAQKELRNRVSYTQIFNADPDAYSPQPGSPAFTHSSASYYTYDIHGNVDVLLQDYQQNFANQAPGNRFKTIHYKYDLISGKVNEVAYQPGMIDGFYHRYQYDAENKLTHVHTSKDGLYWEQEAQYKYYRHGPMARTVLGQLQVQGIDYAYTIQGWLKGVNGTGSQGTDMGKDGLSFVTPPTPAAPPTGSLVARDAFSFSLNYFNTDYKAIVNTANPFAAILTGGALPAAGDGLSAGNSLYNGNIAAMAVNIPKLGGTMVYGYKYDQLNRIVRMNAYNGLNTGNNTFTPAATDKYAERISYDANGNILTYLRNANAARLQMDNLSYSYKPGTNQLDKVTDAATDAALDEYSKYNDIKQGQENGNYTYDEIGNLISDASEGINTIEWNVYGKIKRIYKSNYDEIVYTYDAAGNRISKTVNKNCSFICPTKTTIYVRDASGNVMSVYEDELTDNNPEPPPSGFHQKEIHLYGSSRLGVVNTNLQVSSPYEEVEIAQPTAGITTFTRGNKFFELSNHLGNVLVTITDKKLAIVPGGAECITGTAPQILNVYERDARAAYVAGQEVNFLPSLFASTESDAFEAYINNTLTACVPPLDLPAGTYYAADVVTANDYYPFGMTMPGRDFSITGNRTRHSINGQERSDELNDNLTTAMYWEYDSRIGRRWNRDPILDMSQSPYACFNNSPIFYADVNGDFPGLGKLWKGIKKAASVAGSFVVGVGKGVVGTVKGVGNLILHPINSAKGIYNAVTNPKKTWSAIKKGWNKFKNADANGKAEMLGEVTAMIAIPVASAKVVSAVSGLGAATEAVTAMSSLMRAEVIVGELQNLGMGAAGAAAVEAASTLAELNTVAAEAAEGLAAVGQAPATIVAVSAEGVSATVATSGLKAMQVAPQLQTVVKQLGGLGAKVDNITVGACSEFNAANSLLLQYPNLLPNMLQWSKAIRPKTMKIIDRCHVCTKMFGAETP
jgi:hypothetical protein